MILHLPEGYDTAIGEGGTNLSAGQRQRIGFARAAYGTPFLIVLDEPNSNLDQDGEASLAAGIENLRRKGAIVVVVAHRPSALSAVNMALMMKDGRAIAFGPKDEVLEKVLQKKSTPPNAQITNSAARS